MTKPTHEMSDYEARAWGALNEHWAHRGKGRFGSLPPKARRLIGDAGSAVVSTAARASKKVAEVTPQVVKDAADRALEVGLRPAVEGAVHLLELASDWTQQVMDPNAVVKKAAKHGQTVDDIADLRKLDMKDCDALLSRTTLSWRTAGAVEGAAMGALALIPVAGGAAAITADVVVIHVMSTAIATRVAYSYGFDARHPDEQEFVEKIVTRSFLAQGGKAATLRDASRAAKALRGRQRWSEKLRDDEKLVAALEKFMRRFYASGKVPVKDIGKAIPVVSMLVGSGMNSYLLGQVAQDAQRYCQTRFLCEKYGLPLPEAINHLVRDEGGQPDVGAE